MAEYLDNPIEKVYDIWKEAVSPLVGENYSTDNVLTVAEFPYARLLLMGLPTVVQDLEGNECATAPSFQIESFAKGNKSLSKVYAIDSASHVVMTRMGFRRTYGPSLIANADSNIKRVVSRYTGFYAGNITLNDAAD